MAGTRRRGGRGARTAPADHAPTRRAGSPRRVHRRGRRLTRGDLVTTTLDFASGREVTVHVPSRPPTAVVFAADGPTACRWAGDLEGTAAARTMIVGVQHAADETRRLHEYSPSFDPALFAAHETFFVDDVRNWVRQRFGPLPASRRTAVFGLSAGAELALALGLRHPEVYGVVLGASPGAGFRPPAELRAPLPRTYLVAGREEPFFLDNAIRWGAALRDAGGQVVLEERDGGHGDPFWRAEFPRMVSWAFG